MELSPKRRKVVVLAASACCMSASLPALTQKHGKVAAAIAVLILGVLVYAIVEFVKLKRQES